MNKFEGVFNNWLNGVVGDGINEIDKICSLLDIDPTDWFNEYLIKRPGDCSGIDILTEMFPDFIFYVSKEFQKPINKYLEICGYNIYQEPMYGLYLNLGYDKVLGFFFFADDKASLTKTFDKLNIVQKQELMTNKIFSYIIHQTKFKIFSKNDVRFLKIKNLNEYNGIIEE